MALCGFGALRASVQKWTIFGGALKTMSKNPSTGLGVPHRNCLKDSSFVFNDVQWQYVGREMALVTTSFLFLLAS